MKNLIDAFRRLLLLGVLGLPGVVLAGPYPGSLKDHGHTGPGDGGLITNLRIAVGGKFGVAGSSMSASGITTSSVTVNGNANSGIPLVLISSQSYNEGNVPLVIQAPNTVSPGTAIVIYGNAVDHTSTIINRTNTGGTVDTLSSTLNSNGGQWTLSVGGVAQETISSNTVTIAGNGGALSIVGSTLNASGLAVTHPTGQISISSQTSVVAGETNVPLVLQSPNTASAGTTIVMDGNAIDHTSRIVARTNGALGTIATETFGFTGTLKSDDINVGGNVQVHITSNSVVVPNTALAVGPTSGNGNQILPVVQIVQGSLVSPSSTTTSGTLQNTSINMTITPKFSTSKILVTCQGQNGETVGTSNLAIGRNGSAVSSTYSGSGGASAGTNSSMFGITYYDSPATTSATTYSVMFAAGSGIGTASVNAGNCIAIEYAQ